MYLRTFSFSRCRIYDCGTPMYMRCDEVRSPLHLCLEPSNTSEGLRHTCPPLCCFSHSASAHPIVARTTVGRMLIFLSRVSMTSSRSRFLDTGRLHIIMIINLRCLISWNRTPLYSLWEAPIPRQISRRAWPSLSVSFCPVTDDQLTF